MKQRSADARGSVMLEFLLAFVPIFLLFLGTIQLALLAVAALVVQHAAVAGARSAVVVLPDDPRFYATAEGEIGQPGKQDGSGDFQRGLLAKLDLGDDAQFADPHPPAAGVQRAEDSPRMVPIRRAVHMALAAIAPDAWSVKQLLLPDFLLDNPQRSAWTALGPHPSSRLLVGLGAYLPVATAVTLPVEPGSSRLFERRVPADATVTVRVTHLVPCLVPVIAGLICHTLLPSLTGSGLSAGGAWNDPTERALRELEHAPAADLQLGLLLGQVPMAVLTAEASLPSQSAPYAYVGEKKPKP